jgi:hypothetical protein
VLSRLSGQPGFLFLAFLAFGFPAFQAFQKKLAFQAFWLSWLSYSGFSFLAFGVATGRFSLCGVPGGVAFQKELKFILISIYTKNNEDL